MTIQHLPDKELIAKFEAAIGFIQRDQRVFKTQTDQEDVQVLQELLKRFKQWREYK